MDVTVEFTVAFVEGSAPHHSKAPGLRRTLPDNETIPLTRAGTKLTARLSVPLMGASYMLTLSGHDFFDSGFDFTILTIGNVPTPLTLNTLARRVTVRRDGRGPIIAFDVMAPRLREVPGPGPRFDRDQTLYRIQANPLGAFPRSPPVSRANGVAPPRQPNGDTFLDPVTVQVQQNRLRFFEHRTGHPMIAAYVPLRALPTAGDYLVYFKPPKHNAASPKDVIEGYLTRDGGSGLLSAMEHSRTTAIMLFLIGEAGPPSPTMLTANGLVAVIEELDATLRAGNPFLVGSGVRSIALAGFSQGGEYLAKVIRGVTTSRMNGLLKAVFVFDCFFPATQDAFKKDLKKWFDSSVNLVIRVYWGFTVHRCDLYADQPAGLGDEGTETRSMSYGHSAGVPDYMWVHFTDAFFKHRCRSLAAAGQDLHHAIPKLFLTHALQTAGMARSLI